MLTQTQNEDLRHAALATLAVRAPAALAPRQILNALKRELDFVPTPADLAAALEFLRGQNFTAATWDELGSTNYWRATSAGILYHERLNAEG